MVIILTGTQSLRMEFQWVKVSLKLLYKVRHIIYQQTLAVAPALARVPANVPVPVPALLVDQAVVVDRGIS